MDKVYFLRDESKLKQVADKLLGSFFKPDLPIITKIHFGEPGNKTALKPEDIRPLIESLKEVQGKTILIDTPVAYLSPRNTVLGYKLVVKQRGFDKISDFRISSSFVLGKTKDFEVEACKELMEAGNVLVISHVKGHPCTGFGGAIKNLGMGGVSVKTKRTQHNLAKPEVGKNCIGCAKCVPLCPGKAIKIEKGRAKVNLSACWGCSTCELSCPTGAMQPKVSLFDDLIAQAASVLINKFPHETYYVNFVKRMSKFCDCGRNSGKIIAPDVGILFSQNPVVIDKASLDLTIKEAGEDPFFKTHHKDSIHHLNFASKYTKWSSKYKLVEV